MLRKAIFISLVHRMACAITLLFLTAPRLALADASVELEQTKSNIVSLIQECNYAEAKEKTQQLMSDFAGNKDLTRILWGIAHTHDKIASRYDKREAFDYSKALCEEIAINYPEDIYATYASLQLAKLRAYELIHEGDYKSAYSVASQIMDDFAGHKQLCRRLWEIANRYDKFKAFEYSKSLCREIVANYPKDEYATYAGLQLAKLGIYELIDAGNYESANSAVSVMISNFAGHKELSRRLYEIAQRYEHKGSLANAKALYARIAADYPNDKYGSAAAIQPAKLNIYELIDAGNYKDADTALSQMMVNFAGHPLLPMAVGILADGYYKQALSLESQGLDEQATWYYQKTITECERILNQLPKTPYTTAEAYYFLGVCHERLGQLEEAIEFYQKVVDKWPDFKYAWNALFLVGFNYEKLKNSGLIPEAKANAKTKVAYERLLKDYPTCTAANIARQWLSRQAETKHKEAAK